MIVFKKMACYNTTIRKKKAGDFVNWNIAPECISVVILVIIWCYSRKGSSLPTLSNILFQGCFLLTFLAIVSNILSTVLLLDNRTMSLCITWVITTIYFILTPLMGLFYFLYSVSIIYSERKIIKRIIGFSLPPAVLYVGIVLLNPFTKLLFDINAQSGYEKGTLPVITYFIFYAYCIANVVIVFLNKKRVDRHIYKILFIFPLIAVFVILIQQLYPHIILTGSAATCALLTIYLHLQNRQIAMDYLTNVSNRWVLLNMITLLMKKSSCHSFCLLVISLRGFKQFNNSYGQQTGDAFLREVCNYLCTLTSHKNIYRFNGDEFAILLEDRQAEKLPYLIETINERMASPWIINACKCSITTVMGIAYYPESAHTLEELISAIEYSISRAKTGKYGSVCYCDQQMLSELERKQQIIQILKDNLANNSFEIYYQPIFSLDSGHFEYAESLMRLTQTPIGPISPSEFIPIAEESGLIVDITYQLLDKVCLFINDMIDKQIPFQAVHVNFSAIQFGQDSLTEKVLEIISRNHTPYSSIKIEFTESTMAENSQTVTDFALAMAKKGIHMGLDDFGTGYSNIASVIDVPFATLKLDKSLIWSAMEHPKSASVVKNFTRTFQELGMNVIAEGVESEEQVEFVTKCGINQVQGFYYARPMPPDETEAFLKKMEVSA